MIDSATPILMDIVRDFAGLVQENEPSWELAYFRFAIEDSVSQAKGSYVTGKDVEIIDTSKNKVFFQSVHDKGQNLLKALGKGDGMFLIIVNNELEYEIKFEYHNMSRWRISKLDGGNGMPEGI